MNNLLTDDIIEFDKNNLEHLNYLGLLRDVMIIKDPKKYFEEAWQHDWIGFKRKHYEKILSKSPSLKKYEHQFVFDDENNMQL